MNIQACILYVCSMVNGKKINETVMDRIYTQRINNTKESIMSAGGWNKGLTNVTGGGFKNHKHTAESIAKLKNRPKEIYKKPKAIEIQTDAICEYGCGTTAKYEFANKKKCCSKSHNSCQGKRDEFSRLDHCDRTAKSLETRLRTGVTKETGRKAKAANLASGHYDRMREIMQEKWATAPWQTNPHCPLVPYKATLLNFQGSYEFNFLQEFETQYNIDWIIQNIKRGPSVWYYDADNIRRLYISDFIIGNTIYEIKSHWTWNKKETDKDLELKNKAKLQQCINEGYDVKLILDGVETKWH